MGGAAPPLGCPWFRATASLDGSLLLINRHYTQNLSLGAAIMWDSRASVSMPGQREAGYGPERKAVG